MYAWLENRKRAVWSACCYFLTLHFCRKGLLFSSHPQSLRWRQLASSMYLLDGEPFWVKTQHLSGKQHSLFGSVSGVQSSVRSVSVTLQSSFAHRRVESSSGSSYFFPHPNLLHWDFGCCLSEEEQWMPITFLDPTSWKEAAHSA